MGVITIIKPDGSTEYTVRPTHAFMGTCSTAKATAAKTVTITPAIDNFLEAGVRITVYFSIANTASNPTLSINGGTAKKIYKGSSAITASLLSIGYHDFIYDGTQWQYVSSYINTTYNNLSASNTATGTRYTVLGAGANTFKFLRGDGSWQTPTDTTYTTFTTAAAGLTPASGANTDKFLRGDGSWVTPTDTTYTTFTTAVNGLVPKPTAANTAKFLRGDGSWVTPTDIDNKVQQSLSTTENYRPIILGHQHGTAGFTPTEEIDITYVNKSISASPATGKILAGGYIISGAATNAFVKADGTAAVPTNTTYSTFTTAAAGLTPTSPGGTAKYLRADGSWQTPTNTTYTTFTTAVAGLTPASGTNTTKFLRGDGSWQAPANTTYTTFTTAAAGLAPTSPGGTAKYLRADGSWQTPPNDNTTYTTFTTAVNGLVPKPTAANTGKYLRGDGSWQVPANTEYHVLNSNHFDAQEPHVVYGPGHFDHHLFLNGEGSWSIPQDTTYASISASNTTTNASYTVPGAGSNTGYFLRGDGTWQTPANTTYTTFTTAAAGLAPTSPGGTAKYLRADGSWQTPANTTYAVLSSSSTSNGSYVVNGVGDSDSAAKYFLRGDGKWDTPPLPEITQGYAVGQSKNSEVDTIYYEYSRSNASGTNIQTITFRDKDDTELLATSLANNQIYHFVFRNGLPSSDKRVVFADSQTHEQISFLRDETSNHWLQRGQDDFSLFPTHIVISFKKTTAGLVYLGPIPVFNMLSTVNTYGGRGHLVPGAGANTDKFLRGDGTWQTVGGGGGTSYSTLSASDHASGTNYVVNGSGTNTGKFLRGDGTWQKPTDTTYLRISASNTGTNASYTVPGAGANTAKFLRGDGTWQTPANTTYANISTTNTTTTESYTVPGAGANTGYFLRGDGYWQHLPISNKIVKEFECETLANIPYSSAINFVGNGMNEALQSAVRNIHYFASAQEILFKFNGRMGYFYEQRELMIFELLIIFNDIARQSLENIGNEYHITVKFEFTPEDRYSAQDVEIQQIGMSNDNKLEIIETNDNTRTLAYDESTSRLSIRELQGNYLNILTYRLDSHNVSPNPNVTQYSIGTQVSLKQYSMIYHKYATVVV